MFRYILKRILIFIPTLLVISLVIFMLGVYAPGDPVANLMTVTSGGENMDDKKAGEEAYIKKWKELGMDLPVFYFTISSQADCDTLYKIHRKAHRETLAALTEQHGNWNEVDRYYKRLQKFENTVLDFVPDSVSTKSWGRLRDNTGNLYYQSKSSTIENTFSKLDRYVSKINDSLNVIQPAFAALKNDYNNISATATTWKNYVPSFNWYGLNNRYHKWITRFARFDFGISYQDRKPIAKKIGDNIFWTMLISIISIILTYILAVPLGVFSAIKKGTTADSITTTFLFILYSLPNFWIATLLIIFLCNPQYLHWFPAFGVGTEAAEGKSFFAALGIRIHHLILPLFCWTYGSLAFLSRQMRGGMLGILRQDYIRTARAKGLPENKVIWKHAFRNSLLPVITIFANIFPLMISGSVVIEVIFTIPGMGRMLVDAMVAQDFPVVFTIVMMVAALTMIGYLIADILYAFVDPRITYSSKK